MNKFVDQGIVLRRINYGESDRILTILTPDHGKISAMAKGVRKAGSKIAGGVELLTVNNMTFMGGRSGLYTIGSSRSSEHFHDILKDFDRTQFAYEVLSRISQLAEQITEPIIYNICEQALRSLNDHGVSLEIVEIWLGLQILELEGQGLNLSRDLHGNKLKPGERYRFDISESVFSPHESGEFGSGHLKMLKLLKLYSPERVAIVTGVQDVLPDCLHLVRTLGR